MLQRLLRGGSVVLAVTIASLLVACQPDRGDHGIGDAERTTTSRNVVDALDRQTADSRQARISGVEYDLYVDVHSSTDWFSGEVTIQFGLTDPSSDLSVDFSGGSVHRVLVNGRPIRVDYNGFFLTLPSATLQNGANSVSVKFEHSYDEDGTGLHRFVDPADGLTYLYTYLWPYYANRLFPLFDQPNLKAEISLTVRAPETWTVVSAGTGNAETSADGSTLWRFSTTPKMSTYVFSLHAGPYRIWEDDADGVPIRLMARRSLAEFVAVDEWFDVTKRGLEFYGRYFDIPYPFRKYDQLIVPDFNIGAMENIGAVTFAEKYVQRQQSDRTERENRASVILHEMAHMWFGNLVTHDWWNGLWLNESFATQMAAIAAVETTEFTDTWHGFFIDDKHAAYERDSLVTTHPIELQVNSTADFFTIFDAITYEKGSSVLKQLAHYVGEENYQRGVSTYLREHSYGTTDLKDFIGHQEKSSAIDLDAWSHEWLYKPGFNTLTVSADCGNNGLRSLTVLQAAPDAHPYLRRHQLDVALYNLDDSGELLPGEVFPLEITGAETTVEVPDGRPCPVMVNPNHNDWTYARIALDDRTVDALEEQLSNIPEPLTRSIFLAALLDRALAGEIALADFIGHAIRLAENEQNIRIQQQISSSIVATIELMQRLRPETDDALAKLLPGLEERSLRHAANATTGDLKRSWFNTFTGVVSTEAGLAIVRALLNGTAEVPGLQISADVRWILLMILSRNGAVDIDALLAVESSSDVSDFGAKSSLMANAAKPDKAVKAKWLSELQNPETLTGLARQRAVMAGLFPPNQTTLQLELLSQVLDALPELSETSDPYFMQSYASVLLTPMCVPESGSLMQKALDQHADRLNSTASRFLREAHQADRECLALRSVQ
jgi:aminopeptidase N